MKKILLKLLFVAFLSSGFAMYSQTALPGTIEVETGDISNNQTSSGTRNVIGSGNGGSNNIIDEFRKNSGVNGTIINHVSIAAGDYDFTFTYYKSSNSNTFQIHSTDASGGSSTLLHSFTLVKNSDTGATTSSYGTQTESVTIPSGVTYITLTNNQPAAVDIDNVIVASAAAKPTITLLGSTPVDVTVGDTYTDAGATALASDGVTVITNDIVTVNPVDANTIGTYTVTYNVTNGGVAADEVTRTVNVVAAGTITSAQSGNWDETTTWVGGVLPILTNDVVIADTHDITVGNGVHAQMNNLAVGGNGASIIQSAGSSMTVTGNITLERSQDGYVFSGSTSVDMGTLIYSGAPVTKADLSSSPRVRITKAVPDADQWHLISYGFTQSRLAEIFADAHYKVSTTTGNEGNLAFATYDGNADPKYSYPYTSTTAAAIGNSDGNIAVDGKGYAVNTAAGETNLAWRARLQTADVSIDISDAGDQFNLVGNPYPAYLHANDNADATNNILRINGANGNSGGVLDEDTIWLWDADMSSFVTKNLGDASFRINPMQGFFVKAKSGGGTSQSFSFTEAMQSHASTDAFFKSSNQRFEIDLSIKSGKLNRSTSIRYMDNMTTSFDNGYDSSMFGGYSSGLEVYTNMVSNDSNKKLAIQSLPTVNIDDMIVPVGINAAANSEITFTAEALNVPNGYKVFLEDRLNNTFKRLDEVNSKYVATVTEQSTEGRFYLHTKSAALSVKSEFLNSVSIYQSQASTLRIVGLSQGKASVSLYNVLGKQVMHTSFDAQGVKELQLPTLAKGIYVVQLETQEGKLNKKIVLE